MTKDTLDSISTPVPTAYQTLSLADFLEGAAHGILVDVRTPKEYEKAHIQGAINIPIFTNEERAEIGTRYVRESRKSAVERGFELVGPKMPHFIAQMNQLQASYERPLPIYVYCWRGGMRSNSMAWLFHMCTYQVHVLQGGYKAYRKGFATLLERPLPIRLLGGMTGCGKTDVLHQMRIQGAQVLDLEALANHKGSAFGHLGLGPQPSNEAFENRLYEELRRFDLGQVIWMEAESRSIGSVFIPDALFNQMKAAFTLHYEVPQPQRLVRLCQDYGKFDTETLKQLFMKIQKRLGYDQLKEALMFLDQGEIEAAARIALRYYDKTYQHSFDQKRTRLTHLLSFSEDDPAQAAHHILQQFNQLSE